MIEYLYNAVRASANEDIILTAIITDEDGEEITAPANTHIMLYEDNNLIHTATGSYTMGKWEFVIPKEITKDLSGRYFYCICAEGASLCFKQPIYFN